MARKLQKKGSMKKKKMVVKKKFKNAILKMKKLSKEKQRQVVKTASNEFIKDVENFFRNIRQKAFLFNSSQKKLLRRHKRKLQALVNSKVSLKRKRKILSMKGGILPIFIPLIAAGIGAGGAVAGSAVHAAISRA